MPPPDGAIIVRIASGRPRARHPFRKKGALKALLRLSAAIDAMNDGRDPNNVYLWRMTPRRLEVEPFRDAVLSVSGALDLQPPRGPLSGLCVVKVRMSA